MSEYGRKNTPALKDDLVLSLKQSNHLEIREEISPRKLSIEQAKELNLLKDILEREKTHM